MLGVLGAGLVAQQVLLHWPWASLSGLGMEGQAALQTLNVTSVGCLLAFVVLQLASIVQHRTPDAGLG